MTSHLVLHIGTHKTGSTAMQNTLWKHAADLQRDGLVYPRLAYRHTGHHGLIAEQVGLGAPYHLRGGGLATMQDLAARYADMGGTLFLSSEEFSRAESNRSVSFAQLREVFRNFDRVTVLCFLRPQWRFLQSIYLEISKNRSPPRPPDLVAEALDTGLCQGLYLDYLKLLDRLEQDFDGSEILLLDYEAATRGSCDVVSIALGAIGVTASFPKPKIANPSPPALPQWAGNLLAEPYPATGGHLCGVAKVLPKISCVLTRAEIAAMRSHFATSNAALIRRRALFQPDFTLTDPVPSSDCMFREDVTINHWLAIAREFARDA